MFGWTRERTAHINAVMVLEQRKLIAQLTGQLMESTAALTKAVALQRELRIELGKSLALVRRQSAELADLRAADRARSA